MSGPDHPFRETKHVWFTEVGAEVTKVGVDGTLASVWFTEV